VCTLNVSAFTAPRNTLVGYRRVALSARNGQLKMSTIEGEESDTKSKKPYAAPEKEVIRRRNFAIISHPDAGKTTMTEVSAGYSRCAIQDAGAVKTRASQRKATSDWMELEKQRGISITSTVLSFEYDGHAINLLDTPGHQDFSEDTYRTLAAADNSVMLVDAAKGLEPQTKKLFEVCRLRGLPIFTFCNKMDRPALSPFDLVDQIEGEFGLQMCPVVWPIGNGDRFKGVLERDSGLIYLFEKGQRGKKAEETTVRLDDPGLRGILGDDQLFDQLMEDVEMLDGLFEPLDMARVLAGEQSPMFFGSAMTNFGVEVFLRRFLTLGQAPPARTTAAGPLAPTHPEFTGFVFKLQANLDPKHRDRLAYVRVCSGKFEKGMKVTHSRTKKNVNLSAAQALFASDRETVETAYPGDIIGLNNPGVFAIGDTIYTGNQPVKYPGIPSFSPECFSYIRNPNPSKYKNYRKGLDQLMEEGAVQLLRAYGDDGNGNPILAAVGTLQFDVVQYRLQDEYGVETILEPVGGYSIARWAENSWEEIKEETASGKLFGVFLAKDQYERPVLLFKNEWKLNSVVQDCPDLKLVPWAMAPEYE
ncbi:unnamed protein product, partial [Heterosigma akashiwo]